ncbi:hypothetical protein ERO13_A09G113166v2 [Gossypium hirsutum]|nr:hypothetical protein ERO13_A09G113166v2 [Gossypium hirsutum]
MLKKIFFFEDKKNKIKEGYGNNNIVKSPTKIIISSKFYFSLCLLFSPFFLDGRRQPSEKPLVCS